MGPIRDVVTLLPIGQHLKDPLGIEGALRDHPTHQEMYLRQRQAWRVFFSWHCSRTKKKCARIHKVM